MISARPGHRGRDLIDRRLNAGFRNHWNIYGNPLLFCLGFGTFLSHSVKQVKTFIDEIKRFVLQKIWVGSPTSLKRLKAKNFRKRKTR